MNPTSNANHPRNHRPDAGRTPDPEAWARRARLAHRTLRRYFRAGRVLLHEAVPRRRQDRRHSYEWPHSQVTAAATDLLVEHVLRPLSRGEQPIVPTWDWLADRPGPRIPLEVDERIEIGWIGHSAIPLTEQAQRYLAEVRTVVAGFGVTLLG